MGEIAISFFGRSNITAIRDTLSEDVIVFLVDNTPGLMRLQRTNCTEQQNAIVKEIRDLMLFNGRANLVNDAAWEDGLTILQWAVDAGDNAIVELLVSIPGVDVNVFYRPLTPLELAVYSCNAGIIEMFGNSPGIVVEKKVQTPLIIAAEIGRTESVEALLKYAAGRLRVNAQDAINMTALHWAARYGHSRIVELLLDYPGIAVNSRNRKGQTPLHIAAAFGHVEVVALLLAFRSVYVNLRDDTGRTALDWANNQKRYRVTRLLQSHVTVIGKK